MKHVIKHSLDQGTARKAAEAAYDSYSKKLPDYSPTADWTSETHCDCGFTAKGIHLTGSMDLEPGGIAMDLNVPLLFRPFKKKAMAVVEREVRKWIDAAERGELD